MYTTPIPPKEDRKNVDVDVSMIKYGQKKAPTQDMKEEKNLVNVRMISGDHLETCIYVALKAGIINKE